MSHSHKPVRGTKSFGIAAGGGVLSGLAVGAVLVFLFAAVAYRMSDPTVHLLPLGLISLGLSALVTGRVSCALWGNRSLIPTLTSGSIYALLIAAAGLSIPGSTLDVGVRCLGVPVILALAMVGGLIGRRGNGRRKHRR